MSPRDVRERFQPGGEVAWQTKVGGAADDTVLEWSARDGASRTESARFEFHLGMLVAARAHVRARGEGEGEGRRTEIYPSPKVLIVRTPTPGGGTDEKMLARDCPTHREEAEADLAKLADPHAKTAKTGR